MKKLVALLLVIHFTPFAYGQTGASQINTLQNGTGPVSRSAQDKANDIVSGKDFGMKGDGHTDDSAALQRAMDFVNASGRGGTVFIPLSINDYMIANTVIQTRGVRLLGASVTGSVLHAMAGGTFQTYTDNGFGEPGVNCQTTGNHNCKILLKLCYTKTDCSTENHFSSIENIQIYGDGLVDTVIYAPNMQEQSYFLNVLVNGFLTFGVWVGGQNWWMDSVYEFPDPSSVQAYGIHSVFIGTGWMSIRHVTFSGVSSGAPGAGLDINGAYGMHIEDIHVENSAVGAKVYNNGSGSITNFYGNPTVPITIQMGANTTDRTDQWSLFAISGGNQGSQLTVCDLTAPAYGSGTCAGFSGVAAVPNTVFNYRIRDAARGIFLTDSGEQNQINSQTVNSSQIFGFGAELAFINPGANTQTFTIDPGNNVIAAGNVGGSIGVNFTNYSQYGHVLSATVTGVFGTLTGTTGQSCNVTFAASPTGYQATGTVLLTGPNAIANGTNIPITGAGQGYSTNGPATAIITTGTATLCNASINTSTSIQNNLSGGTYVNGYCQNDPSCGAFQSGVSSDEATFIARATSASVMLQRGGTTQFTADTGLTVGSIFGPSTKLSITPTGLSIPPFGGTTLLGYTGNRIYQPSTAQVTSILGLGTAAFQPISAFDAAGAAATAVSAISGGAINSGTIGAAYIPLPTPTTIGGVKSFTAGSHQWINSITTVGGLTSTQPAFSDLSGTATVGQLPSGSLTEATSGVLTIVGGASLLGPITIQVKQSTTSVPGYLSAADWTTFNGKQTALGYTPLNQANNLSDVTAATARTNLAVPGLAGANTFASTQTFTVAPVFTAASGTRTALGVPGLTTANTLTGVNTISPGETAASGGSFIPLTIAATASGAFTEPAIFMLVTNGPTLTGGALTPQSTAIFIQPQKVTGVTTGYGVYQSGTADLSYFGGKVGFGVVPSSTAMLQVQGHLYSSGSAPALSSCGTSPGFSGTDSKGLIFTGTGATSCTLTFATAYPTQPVCMVNNVQTGGVPPLTMSASAIVLTSVVASNNYHFICIQ